MSLLLRLGVCKEYKIFNYFINSILKITRFFCRKMSLLVIVVLLVLVSSVVLIIIVIDEICQNQSPERKMNDKY